MWKNEMHSFVDSSPGNDPVPVGFNCLGGLSGPKMKFKVTNVFDHMVVCDCGVHAQEYNIKVNSLSCEDVVLLRIRKPKGTFGSEDHVFCCLDIKHMILQHPVALAGGPGFQMH
jgi:hypothetical protein